ncbi:Unknown protein sequence, partial [Pseudomonas syringae pv. coryli]
VYYVKLCIFLSAIRFATEYAVFTHYFHRVLSWAFANDLTHLFFRNGHFIPPG